MPLPAPFSSVANQASSAVRSVGTTIGLYIALALIGLVGVGFLLAACYIWLAALTDPLQAALIMGIGFVLIAGIWAAVIGNQARARQRRRREAAANTAAMASTLSLAGAGIKLLSRTRGPMFFPAAATLFAAWYFTRSRRDD